MARVEKKYRHLTEEKKEQFDMLRLELKKKNKELHIVLNDQEMVRYKQEMQHQAKSNEEEIQMAD